MVKNMENAIKTMELKKGEYEDFEGLFGFVIVEAILDERNTRADIGERVALMMELEPKYENMLYAVVEEPYKYINYGNANNYQKMGEHIAARAFSEDVGYYDIGKRVFQELKKDPKSETMLYAITSRNLSWIIKEMDNLKDYYDSF